MIRMLLCNTTASLHESGNQWIFFQDMAFYNLWTSRCWLHESSSRATANTFLTSQWASRPRSFCHIIWVHDSYSLSQYGLDPRILALYLHNMVLFIWEMAEPKSFANNQQSKPFGKLISWKKHFLQHIKLGMSLLSKKKKGLVRSLQTLIRVFIGISLGLVIWKVKVKLQFDNSSLSS